jgi:transposase
MAHIYDGKRAWTLTYRAWVRRQRFSDPDAQSALAHMLCHLEAIDAEIAALDAELERIANTEPWCDPVAWLCCFRGIKALTAVSLLAEIGDFRRFGRARELMSFLGLTPSEYSSGEQRHRGRITKSGNAHVRRLLVEAAWNYQRRPRVSKRIAGLQTHVPPEVFAPAWSAQVRLAARHRALQANGKRSTVANVAIARELSGFIWAAMTHQPMREEVMS